MSDDEMSEVKLLWSGLTKAAMSAPEASVVGYKRRHIKQRAEMLL